MFSLLDCRVCDVVVLSLMEAEGVVALVTFVQLPSGGVLRSVNAFGFPWIM